MPDLSLKYAKFITPHKRGEMMRFIAFFALYKFLPVSHEFFIKKFLEWKINSLHFLLNKMLEILKYDARNMPNMPLKKFICQAIFKYARFMDFGL